MIEFDTSDTSLTGGMIPPGLYHAVVEDIAPDEEGRVIATLLMVAGANPDGIDKKQKEFFRFDSKGAKNRFLTFALAVGIITKEQWESAKTAGTPINIDESKAIMRSCIVDIKMQPYKGNNDDKKGKEFPQVDYRFYSLDDEKFKHVQRNPDYLPRSGGAGGANPAAPIQPDNLPGGSTAAAASGGDWSSF